MKKISDSVYSVGDRVACCINGDEGTIVKIKLGNEDQIWCEVKWDCGFIGNEPESEIRGI